MLEHFNIFYGTSKNSVLEHYKRKNYRTIQGMLEHSFHRVKKKKKYRLPVEEKRMDLLNKNKSPNMKMKNQSKLG